MGREPDRVARRDLTVCIFPARLSEDVCSLKRSALATHEKRSCLVDNRD